MDDNYKTPLITAAIEMAARNIDLPADAVFHSDRGSNYQCRLVNYGECIHTFPHGDTRRFCGNPPRFRIAFR
jgi:hypothetical protein